MKIPTLYSAKRIERQFYTGEEPVIVMCSDVNLYVCKYMRSSATAYKLAKLRVDYFDYLNQSNMTISEIVDLMPQEWNVPTEAVRTKLIQLFDPQWTTSVWKNFTECLTENMNNHEI